MHLHYSYIANNEKSGNEFSSPVQAVKDEAHREKVLADGALVGSEPYAAMNHAEIRNRCMRSFTRGLMVGRQEG